MKTKLFSGDSSISRKEADKELTQKVNIFIFKQPIKDIKYSYAYVEEMRLHHCEAVVRFGDETDENN